MPPNFLQKHIPTIVDIGQPTTACFFTLSNVDPTGWQVFAFFLGYITRHSANQIHRWVFEKYDGVRGFWNPLKQTFYSRNGNKLKLPQKIIDAMPKKPLFLDGELWSVELKRLLPVNTFLPFRLL